MILLLIASSAFGVLTPLAPQPDWSRLNAFQETITRRDFLALLDKVYAPGGAWKETITVEDTAAHVMTQPGAPPFLLSFAISRETAKSIPRYWRSRLQLPPEEPNRPLAGLRIALDPGHIGGYWAKMEERWFQLGDAPPVTEGDMTLTVAQHLASRLEKLGAEVFLTRSRSAPATPLLIGQLGTAATESLVNQAIPGDQAAGKKESERLFYRVAEIRRRATLVNQVLRPDIVICLHFNAEGWGDPGKPELVEQSHVRG